jgi:hypothetical protein
MSLNGASVAFAQDECLIGFDDEADVIPDGDGTVTCDECDANCDSDGQKDGKCTFRFRTCINRGDSSCTATELKKPKIKGKKAKGFKSGLTPNGTSSVCGAFVDYQVKLKKKGAKAGKAVIRATAISTAKPKRKDTDVLTLQCNPAPATCPTSSTTTTTLPGNQCGNGMVDGGEQCDPAATPTGCSTGICDSACTCVSSLNCCQPTQIVTSSGPGLLAVSTLPAFPFPSGVLTTVNAPAADANCVHDVTVPAGGFTVPVFCIPALGFTSQVTPLGCEAGGADGNGKVWDAVAPCPDADVSRVGDTSDPSTNNCGTLGGGCNTSNGNAGFDTGGNINTTRGDGTCDAADGVHTQLDIPVESRTWSDADGNCPDDDGVYDAGTDTLVTLFNFILSPTTASSNANYEDLNADSCAFAGNGPDHTKHCSNDFSRPCQNNAACQSGGTCVDTPTGALVGIPPAGPCCVVGQTTTVVATGIAFSGGSPLFDLIFANQTPSTITACNALPASSDTCTLNTNACLD